MNEEKWAISMAQLKKKCISPRIPADGSVCGKQLPRAAAFTSARKEDCWVKRQERKGTVFLDLTRGARFWGLPEVPDQILKGVN